MIDDRSVASPLDQQTAAAGAGGRQGADPRKAREDGEEHLRGERFDERRGGGRGPDPARPGDGTGRDARVNQDRGQSLAAEEVEQARSG